MKQEIFPASFFINFFCLLGSTLRPRKHLEGKKTMENRQRNIQVIIRLNEYEKELFEEKRKLAKCNNMSLFIRKCVLEKEIYHIDLEPFAELQGLLYNATNNINQIAKRVNSTGIIYRDDINDTKKQIEHFSKELWQIHSLLLNRTK
jgi:probable mobilization protein